MAFTYFVDDPLIGPTHAEKTAKDSKIQFRSMGYKKTDPPPPFMLVFDDNLIGKYDTSKVTKAIGGGGVGDTTFLSKLTPSGSFHEVIVTLLKKDAAGHSVVHPDEGYKYTVIMNGKAWDPRVVPR